MWMNEAECILYSNNFLSILTHISRSSEVFFFFFLCQISLRILVVLGNRYTRT
jgi:hypothetical protein